MPAVTTYGQQMVQVIGTMGVTISTAIPNQAAAAGGAPSLLLETSDHLLLETADRLLLE